MMKRLLPLALLLAHLLLAACGGDGASEPADATAGPRAAFQAYRTALRAGDLEGLRAVLAAEAREKLDQASPELVVGMLKSFVPSEETVAGVEVSGEQATIRLTSEDQGAEARGKVFLVREDGAWRVVKESWNFGGGEPDEPGPAPDEIPDREPDGDWRLDCHGLEITDAPAAGRHGGEPFTVRNAHLQNEILTLTDGDRFDWSGQFVIFLFFHQGEKALAGRTISIGPEQDFDAEVGAHVHFTRPGTDGAPETGMETDGFALRLEFGEPKDGKLPGRIHLSYPDEKRSFVVGSFTAVLE